MVLPREGNEAWGDGRRGIGASHSTGEAGESGPRDPVEGRGRRQMEPLKGTMANTPRLDSVSPKRQRIAELARQAPAMVFTSLAHHIDRDVLHAAYVATRKDGAVGLDGQTADEYAANLEANLRSLLDRFKSGQYVAPPVRRVHIPKGDGRTTRPIGIPTFEDKVLQRAVVMVLESVYEQDFRDCSFGFRPGRSAHQAVQHLWEQTMLMGGGWVIDLDIQGFFDALDHRHLRSVLDQRVRDGVLRRAIDKWLKAGVLEDGRVRRSVLGTPQGGVVSPLLANIYLHHVLDVWFTTEVQPRLRGRSVLVRYADDVVIVVEQEADAHRVLDVLPKRLGRFGLTMHPEQDGDRFPLPGTFDFLGFTHYWCIARNGSWVLKRKTAKDRLRRSLTAVNRWCCTHRHVSIAEQHRMLVWKLRGHCAYFGIRGNASSLTTFGFHVVHIWQKWLNRRSQQRSMPWARFLRLLARYPLPRMTAVHLAPGV